jgi:hypothetical protein
VEIVFWFVVGVIFVLAMIGAVLALLELLPIALIVVGLLVLSARR